MQLGIHFVNFTLPGAPASLAGTLAETARTADDGGVSTFTVMDHWFQMEMMAPATDPMLEGYTALGFLAGHTRRMRLGLLVTGVTYRHPGLLAKIVTTLDVLSGGRAQLGIGAAWYEREHRGLGVPFPPLTERFERLEEALQVCLQMWSDNNGPLPRPALPAGRDHLLTRAHQLTPPAHPHRRRRRTKDTAARGPLRRCLQPVRLITRRGGPQARCVRQHCDTEGRDPAGIDRTILAMANPLDDPAGFIATMADYAALGITTVEVMPTGDPIAYTHQVIDRIVPALEKIGP